MVDWGFCLGLAGLVLSAAGCKFMPNEPYWIEGFGAGRAEHISAWPGGALAIAPDALLYTYPGLWARPWVNHSGQQLRAVAGSNNTIYGVQTDGRVARFIGGSWRAFAGSEAWGVSELGVTTDDRLLVVAAGKLREVEAEQLKGEPCGELAIASVAAVSTNLAFVLEQTGAVRRVADGKCEPLETPAKMQRLAASAGRLLAVSVDGAVWRRRGDSPWVKLPVALKYRPGRHGAPVRAKEVAVSAYSTWLLDSDGSVFVLSDEA